MYFSQKERAELTSEDDHKSFAYVWTRKEALVKATGRSLDEVLSEPVLQHTVRFDNRVWHLHSLHVGSSHQCAIVHDHPVREVCIRMIDFPEVMSC